MIDKKIQDDVFELLLNKINLNITIKDLIYHNMINSDISKYEDYTLEEFIIISKLDRLFELNIISNMKYAYLFNLIKLKKELIDILQIELAKDLEKKDKDIQKKISFLCKKIIKIDDILANNKLNLDNINIRLLIDLVIQNDNINKDNMKSMIKK